MANNKIGKGVNKNIISLIANRGISQILVFVSTLFAARNASPEIFGAVGLFTSFCSFLSMASSLRFEIRALSCRHESVRNIFIACAYAANLILFFILLALCFILIVLFDQPWWFLLIPLGVFLTSLVNYVIPSHNTEMESLNRLGRMNQIGGVVVSAGQVVSSLMFPSAFSLISSRIVGWIASVSFMHNGVFKYLRMSFRIGKRRFIRAFLCSRDEIRFGVPAAVVSVATLQIPVVIFNLMGYSKSAGFFWLAFNILFTPYFVVMGSVRPIFLRRMSEWRASGSVYNKIKKSYFSCVLFGFLFCFLMGVVAYFLINIFLGEAWADAFHYSNSLSIVLFSLIAQAPIAIGVSAFGLQKENFIFGIFHVLSRALALAACLYLIEDDIFAMYVFSMICVIGYFVYVHHCLMKIKNKFG